ncbi:MAG TPA: transglycosylase SLT domain-containing protein [Gammaproteobacteria bacterium]
MPTSVADRRRARLGLLGLLLAALLPWPALADDQHGLQAQRAAFLDARQALRSGDRPRYRALLAQLGDYPLLPYLRYWELEAELPRLRPEQLDAGLAELAATPLAERLRAAWLERLAAESRWAEYVAYYRDGDGTEASCRYHDALRRLGRSAAAWAGAQQLWLAGRSQPRACDPLFAAWREAGRLTPALAWQRVELAMRRRQLGLARYLERFLPAAERPLVGLWIAMHRDPASRLDDARLAADGPRQRQIALHGMQRLARRDHDAAVARWPAVSARHAFTPAERAGIERWIALEYAFDADPRALSRFEQLAPEWRDETVHEWAVRAALRQGDWPTALAWLERMPEAQRALADWQYWRARALEQTGRAAAARPLYEQLSEGRGYYEFLAADRLGRGYRFDHVPAPSDPTLAAALGANPAFVRARELFFAGLRLDARREWYAALDGQGDALQVVAARLASHWGWHDRAIFALGAAGYWDDLEIRFPLAFREELTRQAQRQRLDPAWVFAVARQESAFAADARSPAGALGLMQIMPATGRKLARDLKTRLPNSSGLLDPDRNVRFGTFYLRQLLDQLDDHPVLANAAYNAGPHRVRAWLPGGDAPLEADIWVENVPFHETRDYLQRVLAYTAIYQQRLGLPVTPLSQRMRPVGGALARSGGSPGGGG